MSSLSPGAALLPTQSIYSFNRIYRLTLQSDSNLVLYRRGRIHPIERALWTSNTVGRNVDYCVMQRDGNLVMYDTSGHAVWSSNTFGNRDSRLVVQDDGNAVIYRPDKTSSWSTNTQQPSLPFGGRPATGDTMHAGQLLLVDRPLRSVNGVYSFTVQRDSNVVLSRPGGALWTSGTNNPYEVQCILQPDGNLVIYEVEFGSALWASNTAGTANARAIMQNDGNFVIYDGDGDPVWSTGTYEGPSARASAPEGIGLLAAPAAAEPSYDTRAMP